MPKQIGRDRYTNYWQEEPEDTGLGTALLGMREGTENFYKRQKEIEDAMRKALILKKLEGNLGGKIDLNKLARGGALPDLNQLQITPDIEDQYKRARLGTANRDLENQRLLSVLSGIEEPSGEDIEKYTPLVPGAGRAVLGQAEGGQVMAPEGATFGEGSIMSPSGEQIGEYMPGYEPKKMPVTPEQVKAAMVEKFGGGIPSEDIRRKAMGLPVFSGKAVGKVQSINNTNKVMQNIQSKEDLQELITNRAEYEAEGVDVDKIIQMSHRYLAE